MSGVGRFWLLARAVAGWRRGREDATPDRSGKARAEKSRRGRSRREDDRQHRPGLAARGMSCAR
jgi:hypothetical protein